ncbi:MAG: hypothetical protein ABL898_00435 [Hyphomicrobiaceae bacterium]
MPMPPCRASPSSFTTVTPGTRSKISLVVRGACASILEGSTRVAADENFSRLPGTIPVDGFTGELAPFRARSAAACDEVNGRSAASGGAATTGAEATGFATAGFAATGLLGAGAGSAAFTAFLGATGLAAIGGALGCSWMT